MMRVSIKDHLISPDPWGDFEMFNCSLRPRTGDLSEESNPSINNAMPRHGHSSAEFANAAIASKDTTCTTVEFRTVAKASSYQKEHFSSTQALWQHQEQEALYFTRLSRTRG